MTLTVNGIPEIVTLAGRDLGCSSWRTVTQELIGAFADVAGDHQWIHTDVELAAGGPFGRTIAHGYMTLSWGVPLLAELLAVTGVRLTLNYGLNRVRFPAPVPVGSRVRLQARIEAVEPVPGDGIQVVRAFVFQIEGSAKPACVAESLTRYYA